MKNEVPFLDLAAATRELRGELEAAARRVMDSGWYVLGPELERFEAEFAAYCGAEHCIGVGNGLEALRLILTAHGIGPGDEVLVPAQTFVATWLAVSAVGATPVPVEIELETGNLDARALEAVVGPRSRAVVAVHLYGRPAEMEKVRAIASRHGLLVVEDAAQAHGATQGGRRAGSLGDAAAFSFYPAKNLGALGDGGAVVTGDRTLAERVRLLRNYGSRKKYHHEVLATNSRLDEIQAAFLRAKLATLDEWNERRRRLAHWYRETLASIRGIALPPPDDDTRSAWHLFVVRVERRDGLRERLSARGIETLVHYPVAPFLAEPYRSLGWSAESFPCAARQAASVLSLPFGPHLEEETAREVVGALAAALDSATGGSSRFA